MAKKERWGGKGKKQGFRLYQDSDLAQATLYALGAARYHWGGMRQYLRRLEVEEDAWAEDQITKEGKTYYNKFYHHMRAFFWELTSAFDTLLHLLNRKYELGLDDGKVDWDSVSALLSQRTEHKKLLRHLSKGFQSRWFTDVRKYRNFAHRGTVLAEVWRFPPDPPEPAEEKLTPPVRVVMVPLGRGRGYGEPIQMCKEYGTRVREFILKVLEEIGEADTLPEPNDQ